MLESAGFLGGNSVKGYYHILMTRRNKFLDCAKKNLLVWLETENSPPD